MKSYKNINPQRSFVTEYVEKHSLKNNFFNEVKSLIDWNSINKDLKKVYTKGLTEKGAKAYSPLLLFKMNLISEWYNLSDIQTESMVNDSLSAMKFCDLTIEGNVPGHSTLSRFKKELKDQKVFDKLLKQVNNQISKHHLKVKKGKAIVDAKLTAL
ncbi:MAG: transposase [Flavobacteriaceae bacterium]|nr:transposase [Flavobacteriaceae bacterium]